MTIEQLLAQLKALETAVARTVDFETELDFHLDLDGSGYIRQMDSAYWSIVRYWHFNTLADLESVLAQALAETRQV